MYTIRFYKDRRGKSPVAEYIKGLAEKKDKNSRVKLEKINDYLQALQEGGTHIGEPYVKHLAGDIWELRPLRDRILYAAWNGQSFVLLHHFIKKTQKTPQWEIKKAKQNLADFRERSEDNEDNE
jgi:phage-related protein